MIATVLIVIAAVLFTLALLGIASRVDLTAAGGLLVCIALLIGRVG